MNRRGLALALIGASLFSACASMKVQDDLEKLKEAVEGYNQAFRWKNYERASLYLPDGKRAAFMAAYDDDERSLQMEDYQVSKVNLHNEDQATVSVRVRFLLLPSVVVENRTLIQHWQRVVGEWILEDEEASIRKLDLAEPAELPPGKPDSTDPYEVEVTPPGEEPGEAGWE